MHQPPGDTANHARPSFPPANEVDLTMIVPTRNEANNVVPLLDRLEAALEGQAIEILFVDDSTDETATVVRREAEERSLPIRLIVRPESRRNGLSGAVVEGMEAARGRWLGVMDADLQHPPELIPRLLAQADRTGADVVIASRQADIWGPVGLSRARALTSQLLTILARMVFPRVLKNVSDPLTGFFLVRRAAVDVATLQPEGFKILLEILARHPDLRVTELHFKFAPRLEGQSKADLNEGVRFFRHLTRLRLTVNQHLVRFLLLILVAAALNLVLLSGLTEAGWPLWRAAAAAGATTIAGLLLGETWVFSDRPRGPVRRRLASVLILGSLFLFVVYLPAIWLLAVRLGAPALVGGLAAMLVAGFVYYLFSEQWIWTRGLMMRPRESIYYDIHGILAVASQIPLNDLDYFLASTPPARIDLQLRVDRHGTPSRVPGAICYDEHLGRFGFGLTVIPGDYTEIVVSPLLEMSPAFVYTNVVEPVLRWLMVTRGFSLARAGAVQSDKRKDNDSPQGWLFTGPSDLGYALGRLCQEEQLAFMGDDRVIIGGDRLMRSFPKPVTARPETLPGQARTIRASVALRTQRLLYSRPIRQLGLFLGRRRLPAATVNTYLQRIIPQPKYPLHSLIDGVAYRDVASVSVLTALEKGDKSVVSLSLETAIDRLLEPDDYAHGFRPYPLLMEALATWDGRDWLEAERQILRAGLAHCRTLSRRHEDDSWWKEIAPLMREPFKTDKRSQVLTSINSANSA
ncbi:MAG: glycosyltransferase family 2 protein [Candidatus Promineofilum sp.]|uniref:glycosyltransferase n=1 Tax=Promineifilum sp. TaxID=2664178 RepID=UPI002411D629|nr:glycosyltransferase family 2 protein [Promineifilum sp.]